MLIGTISSGVQSQGATALFVPAAGLVEGAEEGEDAFDEVFALGDALTLPAVAQTVVWPTTKVTCHQNAAKYPLISYRRSSFWNREVYRSEGQSSLRFVDSAY